MSRADPTLELFRTVVQLADEAFVEVPDLTLEPGQVVTMEACYESATRLVDFVAGRGRSCLHQGWVDLGGHALLALSPEERLSQGLHAPSPFPDALRDTAGMERLLVEVNRCRALLELPSLAPLTAIMRAGFDPPLGPGHRRAATPDDEVLSALAQVRLVGAPMAIVALPAELGPDARRLLALTLAEVRGQGRGLLLLGPRDDLDGLLGEVRHAGRVPPATEADALIAC